MQPKRPRSRKRPQAINAPPSERPERRSSPTRRLVASSPSEVDIDRLTPNDFQPRVIDRRRAAAGSRAVDQSERRHPADHRPPRTAITFRSSRANGDGAPRNYAGLMRVPIVDPGGRAGQEQSLLEMALIENIQRENLNPIDEALAYRRLADEFQLTQEDDRLGGREGSRVGRQHRAPAEAAARKSGPRWPAAGSSWAMRARCSSLDRRGRPAANGARRHRARTLGPRNRNTRQEDRRRPRTAAKRRRPKPVDVHTRAAEERLKLLLGTRVRIVRRGQRGRIEIDFNNEDELIRIYEQLTEQDKRMEKLTRLVRESVIQVSRAKSLTQKGGNDDATHADGLLRRLSEQTRRRRARSGAE